MAAKSPSNRCRSASVPELASTSSCPNPSKAASRETRFSGVSSTRRILIRLGTGSLAALLGVAVVITPYSNCWNGHLCLFIATAHRNAQHREELLQVHRLGDVIGSAGLDTFCAVTLHCLGGKGDDRQRAEPRLLANCAHGFVP